MPSFVQLLVIIAVALIVVVIWRLTRGRSAQDEDTTQLTNQGDERRTAARRVLPERRQSVRPEPDRRQGGGRRADDQSD